MFVPGRLLRSLHIGVIAAAACTLAVSAQQPAFAGRH